MPKRLLDRCQPDSIREFRVAARHRFHDALSLMAAGQRTGAIYLCGYVAEMTLKSAYFSVVGLPETHAITWSADIRPAIDRGRVHFGIYWPNQGAGHNVRAWAELLVLERSLLPTTVFPPSFANAVQLKGQQIESLWRETLRYHKNYAYAYEVEQMRRATEWLLMNSDAL